MYIKEKKGNNESVKNFLNTYPPLFKPACSRCAAGRLFSKGEIVPIQRYLKIPSFMNLYSS